MTRATKKKKSRPPRLRRTPTDLQSLSRDLGYELGMFAALALQLAALPQPTDADAVEVKMHHNAYVTAFLIHARSLYDFFYTGPEKAKNGDGIAEDFALDRPWSDVRPSSPPELERARGPIGRRAAHLTYGRQEVTGDDRFWPFAAMAKEMAGIARAFLTWAPPEYLTPQARPK